MVEDEDDEVLDPVLLEDLECQLGLAPDIYNKQTYEGDEDEEDGIGSEELELSCEED